MRDHNVISFPAPARTRDERTKPRATDTPLLKEFKSLAASLKAEQEDAREDREAMRRRAEQAAERD